MLAKIIPTLGLLISVAFLLNFSMGILEIPDNLPIVGHIDEVLACTILFASLGALGVRLPGQKKHAPTSSPN